MELPDIPKVEVCCSSSSDRGDCFNEVGGGFVYRVDGYHDRVIPTQFWEFQDKIHADDVPTFFQDQERWEFSTG